jgi:methyl-galactoside transport system permease protein
MPDKKTAGKFLLNNAVIILLLMASFAVGIMRPAFFSEANFRNLISNTAIRFIIALGVSGCLITKGTDLSAGRAVGLASCLAATFCSAPIIPARCTQVWATSTCSACLSALSQSPR